MSVLMLYALVPADQLSPSGAVGGLSRLAEGSVAALYEEREQAPRPDHAQVVAFGEVVAEIAQAGPALPVRFGTVVGSRAQLHELLQEREAEWRDRLLAVAGKVEVLVHARDETAPEPAAAAPGAGWEYLMSRAAALRHADTMYADLMAVLTPHCRELRRLPGSGEIRVACLVPADATEELTAALRGWAAARSGRHATMTGPWPPFSFTEEEPR